MITIIAGGRDHVFSKRDFELLDQYRAILPITEVCSGKAMGADYMGELWAKTRKLPLHEFDPNKMDLSIPFALRAKLRNQQMADFADALIAFPGGSGTADMIKRATEGKLVVIIVKDVEQAIAETFGVPKHGE